MLSAIPLAAQTDLTGLWVLRVATGDGNYRETDKIHPDEYGDYRD